MKKRSAQSIRFDRSQFQTLPLWSWLFPTLAVIGIFITGIGLLIPQVLNTVELYGELEPLNEELDNLVVKRESLERLSESEVRDRLRLAEFVLPSSNPAISFTQTFAALLQNHPEISVDNYELSPGLISSASADAKKPADDNEIHFVDTEIGIRGTYGSLLAFLDDLEVAAPMLGVIGFSLEDPYNPYLDVQTQDLRSTLVIASYYAPLTTKIGGVGDPLPAYEGEFDETYSLMEEFTTFVDEANSIPEGLLELRENPFTFP